MWTERASVRRSGNKGVWVWERVSVNVGPRSPSYNRTATVDVQCWSAWRPMSGPNIEIWGDAIGDGGGLVFINDKVRKVPQHRYVKLRDSPLERWLSG